MIKMKSPGTFAGNIKNDNFRILQKTFHKPVIMSYQRRLLFVVLMLSCVFINNKVIAQDKQLDSLNALLLKAKSDTDRLKINLSKLYLLSKDNLDTAIQFAKQQLKLAEKIHYYKAIIDLHFSLANNYSFRGDFDSSKMEIENLEKIVKPTDSITMAGIYGAYGMMYGIKAVYDTSIQYIEKAIPINTRLNNLDELYGNYTNIAIGYTQLANYPKALEYQQKALKIEEKFNDPSDIANLLVNMGITYVNIGDYTKAEAIYLKAAGIASKNKSSIIELYAYTNLSSLYQRKRSWDKGYIYAMKAVDIAKKTGDVGIEGASLAKAAIALTYQGKYKEAEILSRQSIILADSSGQPLNIFQAYGSMAEIFYMQKNYKGAIPYFEKAFKSVNGATNYDETTGDYSRELSECYEKTGNYFKALSYFKLSAEIKDSSTRKDNVRKATELSMNYEFEKKQQAEKAEQQKRDEVTKTKQTAMIIGLAFLLIAAIIAFKGYKNKQHANTLLKSQKKQIEDTLTELKNTQAQLIQSEKMASLGELTAGIAHEIQNPLNFVNNFSEVNKELIEELNAERSKPSSERDEQLVNEIVNDIKDNAEKINHHGQRAADIVKGMLQHSRKSTGVKEPTDINALCDEYLRLSYHGLRAKDKTFNAKFETDFDDSLPKINVVPQDIGRVILNLINNAFYAVNERNKNPLGLEYTPTVKVVTKKLNNTIEIIVSDNGNGIPDKIKDKIFQPFFTTKPTGQGTGLGLSLSYDIVKAHGGEIKVESPVADETGKESEGTQFIVKIPV